MAAMKSDLADHLEAEDLGEYERRKSQLSYDCNPLATYELFNARKDKSKLASCPPVKLYVSKIPALLNINGLRNIFKPYGELRDVSHPKIGNNGQTEFKYAFVSYSNTREALTAIENLSERPPLHLEVKLSRDEQEAYRKRRMEEEMEKFSLRVPCQEEEEEDWEKEIAEREKMEASVDRFLEDEVGGTESDGEIRPSTEAGKANTGAVQKVSGTKDSSGRDIFTEADLPETDLKKNSLANILEVKSRWAHLRIRGLRREMNHLEDRMKEESTEFLRSSPSVKQLCVFHRAGKFARVIVDAVKDSGGVQIHGVDDGTRLKVEDWRELRYIPAGLVRQPPLCVMVKLERPPPRDVEEVKVKYLGHRKGYPVVELTGVSSDVLAESDKASSEHTVVDQENNINSEVLETRINEEIISATDNSKALGLIIGETEKVKVTHVESPREVYFMKRSDKENLAQFYEQISKAAESLECQADFSPGFGSMVFVKASDNYWYRGEVLSIEGPSHLRFYAVDFGFTEVVGRKRVRDIPATLSSIKTRQYFAVKCSLRGWEQGTPVHTKDEIKEIKEKLPVSSSSKVKVIHHDQKDGVYTVAIKNILRNSVSFV